MTMNKTYSYPELRSTLESLNATECRIHAYGYEDKEVSEDPIQQIFGLEESMKWIAENPAYSFWGEMTGYMIVVFGNDGKYAGTIIF